MAASTARNVPVTGATAPIGSTRRAPRVNADTTAQPEGLTRRVVLNILEAFFRRPWLHLLPLIIMLALGAATAFNKQDEYRSVGTITALRSTLISDITQVNNNGFSFETPSTLTARNINEKLRTNEFVNTVADKLGLEAGSQRDQLLQIIARSVGASADGDQLVRVSATTRQPDLSLSLANATVDSYIETVKNATLSQSEAAVSFFESELQAADTARQAARQKLLDFYQQNDIQDLAKIPVSLQLDVQALQDEVQRLDAAYDAKQDQLDQARLTAATAQTDTEQRLRVTDRPTQAGAPQPYLRKAVLTMMVFGVLGVLLSLASVIVAAALDRTIRVPADVTAKFGLDVLAVIPDSRAR